MVVLFEMFGFIKGDIGVVDQIFRMYMVFQCYCYVNVGGYIYVDVFIVKWLGYFGFDFVDLVCKFCFIVLVG